MKKFFRAIAKFFSAEHDITNRMEQSVEGSTSIAEAEDRMRDFLAKSGRNFS